MLHTQQSSGYSRRILESQSVRIRPNAVGKIVSYVSYITRGRVEGLDIKLDTFQDLALSEDERPVSRSGHFVPDIRWTVGYVRYGFVCRNDLT
jgi:hypothetical protein